MRPIRDDRHQGTYRHPNGNPNQALPFTRHKGKVLSTWEFDEDERALLNHDGVLWVWLFGARRFLDRMRPSVIIDEQEEREMIPRARDATSQATGFCLPHFTPIRPLLLAAGRCDILIPVEPIPPLAVSIQNPER